MELIEGETLRHAFPPEPASDEEDPRGRRADRGRPREGARIRHRPPRPEAREHDGVPRRLGEDPRLRPREARRGRSTGAVVRAATASGNGARNGHGHGRIHVAGAGEREDASTSARTSSRSGRSSTRWRPAVAPSSATRAPRRSSRSSARSPSRSEAEPARAGAAALDHRTLPREGPGGTLRLDEGPRARSRGPARTSSGARFGRVRGRRRGAGRRAPDVSAPELSAAGRSCPRVSLPTAGRSSTAPRWTGVRAASSRPGPRARSRAR